MWLYTAAAVLLHEHDSSVVLLLFIGCWQTKFKGAYRHQLESHDGFIHLLPVEMIHHWLSVRFRADLKILLLVFKPSAVGLLPLPCFYSDALINLFWKCAV